MGQHGQIHVIHNTSQVVRVVYTLLVHVTFVHSKVKVGGGRLE